MELKYVRAFKTPLKALKGGKGDTLTNLLWGDPVHVINSASRDTWLEVMARNHDKGYIKRSALMDKPILEIYIIDVGQGDGVLMKTPNTLVTVPGNDKKEIDRTMAHVLLADNFDYGLVSVRTDGEAILIANKIESRADFDIQIIKL
jgi:hypothetical protein